MTWDTVNQYVFYTTLLSFLKIKMENQIIIITRKGKMLK